MKQHTPTLQQEHLGIYIYNYILIPATFRTQCNVFRLDTHTHTHIFELSSLFALSALFPTRFRSCRTVWRSLATFLRQSTVVRVASNWSGRLLNLTKHCRYPAALNCTKFQLALPPTPLATSVLVVRMFLCVIFRIQYLLAPFVGSGSVWQIRRVCSFISLNRVAWRRCLCHWPC